MNRRTTITVFYIGVAIICAAILAIVNLVIVPRFEAKRPDMAEFVNAGRQETTEWFPIQKDLVATNQDGETVKLSDLRGKVVVLAQFFAVCPHCAVRNGAEMRAIYDEFGDNPDFHIVCITVDPDEDDIEKLSTYAKALGAETKNWWFLNAGDEMATHTYLEEELKFFAIRERGDPLEIEEHGRFSHDLGLLLIDRDFQVIGKFPLAESRLETARERDPELYDTLKKNLFGRIKSELDQDPETDI